ncbi:MAG TPA: sulfotransferase domain-containing protein [Micromonosporaceae bacterium]
MPLRYQSSDEDSARWIGFPFRDGDIVISTRSKSGTTWMQMICALLVFQQTDLPGTLTGLSPWLDWLITPKDEVYAHLAAQTHRRFIKTHTPLDGVPIDDRATYIVVARHPLDMAVSLYHQGANLNRERMRELTGAPAPTEPPKPRPPLHEWLARWIDRDDDPRESLDDLPGVLLHVNDAWSHRDRPNVILVHYADLSADLEGEMRRIADRLGIEVDPERWPALVEAASFQSMRDQAEFAAPSGNGVLLDNKAFFRRGRSGAGREQLSDSEYQHYLDRAASLAGPDVLAWLHR